MFSKWKDARTKRRLKLIAQIQYLRRDEAQYGTDYTKDWCDFAIEQIQDGIYPPKKPAKDA